MLNTKKMIFLVLATLLILISACDTITAAPRDLIGVWVDIEYPSVGIQFTGDFRFYDVLFDEIVGRGYYRIPRSGVIDLEYTTNCDSDCFITLGYDVSGNTLIITDAYGEIRYRRAGSP